MKNALDLVLPGADDTRREAMAWLASLAKERRLSGKTVEAYGRDLRQFLAAQPPCSAPAPAKPQIPVWP